TGRRLASLPLGESATQRFGAPYRTVHRADLQRLLLTAIRRNPDIDLRLGTELAEFTTHADGVSLIGVASDRPVEISGKALIGVEGVNSSVRRALPGATEARFTGRIAWRA